MVPLLELQGQSPQCGDGTIVDTYEVNFHKLTNRYNLPTACGGNYSRAEFEEIDLLLSANVTGPGGLSAVRVRADNIYGNFETLLFWQDIIEGQISMVVRGPRPVGRDYIENLEVVINGIVHQTVNLTGAWDTIVIDNLQPGLYWLELRPGSIVSGGQGQEAWIDLASLQVSVTCTTTEIVCDTIAPTFTTSLPSDIVISCRTAVPAPDVLSAVDVCNDPVDVLFTEQITWGQCTTIYTRTWIASDTCANQVSHTQRVYVIDDAPPIILGVPEDVTVACIEAVPPPDTLQVIDFCSGVYSLEYFQVQDSVTVSNIWIATDVCGNVTQDTQRVTIVPMIVTYSVEQPTCGQAWGSATIMITGGEAPYQVIWNDGASTSAMRDSLLPGLYQALIKDANGCREWVSFTINTSSQLQLSLTPMHTSCHEFHNGRVTAGVSGGVGPYEYRWSTGAIQQTDQSTVMLHSLPPGDYEVTVVDARGCTVTGTTTVIEPPPLEASVVTTPASCGADPNGTAEITVEGGTQPYTLRWQDGSGSMMELREDLSSGQHIVLVADALGCQLLVEVNIGCDGCKIWSYGSTLYCRIGLYEPIPPDGPVDIRVFSTTGRQVAAFRGTVLQGVFLLEETLLVPAGIYVVLVETEDGRVRKAQKVVIN